jgi:hypothetical protein
MSAFKHLYKEEDNMLTGDWDSLSPKNMKIEN